MNKLLYFSIVAGSLTLASCVNKDDDPQVADPDSISTQQPLKRVTIDATITKIGPTSQARFSISRKPKPGRFLSPKEQFVFFELGLNRNTDTAPMSYQQSASLEQADLKSDSLYLSLYYVDTDTNGFIKPRVGDEVTVQVRISGRSPITLRVNPSTYQDSTNSWMNHNGYLNSGVEKVLSL